MKKGRTQKSMIFQYPIALPFLEFGIWNWGQGIWNWEQGILRVSSPRTGRRFRVASGTPYGDHRARTGRTDGPVEMT